MSRILSTLIAAVALVALLCGVGLSAEPTVSKSVATEDDGTAVLIVQVRASDQAIYGINVVDATASVIDLVAPKGWAAISSGDRVVLSTVDTPIEAGESVVFRLVTTNKAAPLRFTFRDAKSLVHTGQTI
jgi:hypothetical protein